MQTIFQHLHNDEDSPIVERTEDDPQSEPHVEAEVCEMETVDKEAVDVGGNLEFINDYLKLHAQHSLTIFLPGGILLINSETRNKSEWLRSA